MAAKPDISSRKLPGWDVYKDKPPEEAAEAIYVRVGEASLMMCGWYWASIRTKRRTSLLVRALAFLSLLLGTTLPLFAALQGSDHDRLFYTQWAIALLATAGLLMVADRAFGWSSGWMRYIVTATTMENLTRAFQLEWGKYLLARSGPLGAQDAKALFELASGFEQELTKLQADETSQWVAEFNTGISLLETMIKTQRDETDRKLDAIRTTLTAQSQISKATQAGPADEAGPPKPP
ncbi:MAG: hypothetical protein RLY71_3087 [Pseudomonadota bacterium]|jgi:methyl-accepting chemotaxis protein